jgi:Leucine-rich repeat (LRR) protein
LIDNKIEEIDKDAFLGLEKLCNLNLMKNPLSQTVNETFYPLTSLNYLDLEANVLVQINDDLISRNRNLTTLYLEFNRLNQISPRFVSQFSDSLKFINLAFDVEDEIGKILLNNVLASGSLMVKFRRIENYDRS